MKNMKQHSDRRKKPGRALWGLVAAVLIAAILIGVLYVNSHREHNPPAPPDNLEEATVLYVIDGDTVVCNIDGKEVTVRLIGVDAPESVNRDESKNTKEGKAAAEYTRSMLTGKTVSLEYDEEKVDQYGRTLAYIWIEWEFFNKRLIEEGHAVPLNIPPNEKYTEVFEIAAGR